MSSPGPSTLWSRGRYESVATRIADIAGQTVAAAAQRRSLAGARLVDLACGTGSAALAAADRGAVVTGVDVTPELLDIARRKAGAREITWVAADAADTGLPTGAFDVAVSNMGIIFVAPDRQVTELRRLLKPTGVLAFSSWVRNVSNPFFDPVVAVFGTPPATGFAPDQWGNPELVHQRLAAGFDDIAITAGTYTWRFDSVADGMHFLQHESPMHVETFARGDDAQRGQLAEAFTDALRDHTDAGGAVSFDAPYVVVTARRRQP